MNALAVLEESLNKNKSSGGVTTSLASLFSEYQSKRTTIEEIASLMHGQEGPIEYFLRGNNCNSLYAKSIFELKGALGALNSEFWSKAMALTDVMECMPAKDRNEWSEMIHSQKTPDFTPDTVIPTLQGFLLSRDTLLARKVEGLFYGLSGNHVTNSPHGFSKRMIIEYVLSVYGAGSHVSYHLNHRTAEQIHDLRSIISKLLKKDPVDSYVTSEDLQNIISNDEFGEWQEFDGGAFKIKLFKKGTIHMEIHPSVAVDLNNILATLHPNAIPATHRTRTTKHKEVPLHMDFLSKSVVTALCYILEKVSRGTSFYVFEKDYSKADYDSLKSVLKFFGGISDGSTWSLDKSVSSALSKVIRMGAIPEKTSHQYYPTEEALASLVVAYASIGRHDSVLEPSAGQGGLCKFINSDRLTCVEISDVNAAVLREKGYNVIEGDFLKVKLGATFDKIVMNPPFASGQAERHVKHAATHLNDEGVLVAVLPASFKDKLLVEDMEHSYSDIIEEAFADTSVSVVILTLSKNP